MIFEIKTGAEKKWLVYTYLTTKTVMQKSFCALSKDLRFDELRKVLESYGYVMNAPKGGSSHYTFRKAGCQPITIPKHEPIKKVYVEIVKQIVESEAVNDENAE